MAEAWQGRAADPHDGARTCFECGASATRDPLDVAWTPTVDGWRCPTCNRRRATAVGALADRLLEQTEPRWALVLDSPPLHDPFDLCLECEALAVAAARLLRSGALTRPESDALTAAVLAAPERARTCARVPLGHRFEAPVSQREPTA